MKVNVIIEKGKDNLFSVNMDYYELDFGLSGFGKTAEEAINDFYQCWEEAKEMCKNEGKEIPELEFNVKYDVTSFLDYYAGILSKSGLEKITGINQKQLWHYSSGRRKPTRKVTQRIQGSLHRFAENLREVQFVD
jgi:predicted RNase H-like HicB family nuclease